MGPGYQRGKRIFAVRLLFEHHRSIRLYPFFDTREHGGGKQTCTASYRRLRVFAFAGSGGRSVWSVKGAKGNVMRLEVSANAHWGLCQPWQCVYSLDKQHR